MLINSRTLDRSRLIDFDISQQQRGSLQHYYETFQDFNPTNFISSTKDDPKTDAEKGMDNLAYLYAGFTAAQAKDKAIKSGTLTHLKREKKMFAPFNIFWLDRSCWVMYKFFFYPCADELDTLFLSFISYILFTILYSQ